MGSIKIIDYEAFTEEFLKMYLANGLGSAPKREIDILIMHLLMKYGDLSRESNHNLSILLQVPESTIKRLRYQARLKYPPDNEYIQREFLFVLANAQFEAEFEKQENIEKIKIIFVMEDNYLRYAIQGRLKEKGMFADTSFNSEVIKIKCSYLVEVIEEIYDKKTADEFLDGFKSLRESSEGLVDLRDKGFLLEIILGIAKTFLSSLATTQLKAYLGIQ